MTAAVPRPTGRRETEGLLDVCRCSIPPAMVPYVTSSRCDAPFGMRVEGGDAEHPGVGGSVTGWGHELSWRCQQLRLGEVCDRIRHTFDT